MKILKWIRWVVVFYYYTSLLSYFQKILKFLVVSYIFFIQIRLRILNILMLKSKS
jgi:hypothetical protein